MSNSPKIPPQKDLRDPNNWPLVELEPAPEIFVDGYQSSTLANGAAKLVFFSLAHNPGTDKNERRVVLRLTMPMPVILGIQRGLTSWIEDLQRQARDVERQAGAQQ